MSSVIFLLIFVNFLFNDCLCLFLCSMYFLLNIYLLHLSGSFLLSLLYFFLMLISLVLVLRLYYGLSLFFTCAVNFLDVSLIFLT